MLQPIEAPCLASLPGIAPRVFHARTAACREGLYASAQLRPGLGGRSGQRRARTAPASPATSAAAIRTSSRSSGAQRAIAVVVGRPGRPRRRAPKADAIVTPHPGSRRRRADGRLRAVLFADPRGAASSAAAHAGWRGRRRRASLEATVAAMEELGRERQRIARPSGPHQPGCLRGRPGVRARLPAADARPTPASSPQDPPRARPHFDLPGYVENR